MLEQAQSGCTDASRILIHGCTILGIHLSDHQTAQFIAYCAALQEANARFNLTALRSPEQIMSGLFLDSLTLVGSIPESLLRETHSVRVVDVGSGSGIPGIPLALLFPRWTFTLVESIGKKATFLQNVTQALRITNVAVIRARAEEAALDTSLRDSADLCMARAVASLPVLIEWCAPFVEPGGWLLFPKSSSVSDEVPSARAAMAALRVRMDDILPVPALPALGSGRLVVRLQKFAVTPAAYPRSPGVARTRPLCSPASSEGTAPREKRARQGRSPRRPPG